MSNVTTLNQLVTRVRTRGDVVGSSTFDDNVELKPWIKGSLSQFHEILIQRFKDYYVQSVALSIIANQDTYALPSDFRIMRDVYVFTGAKFARQKLRAFQGEEYGGSPISGSPLRYRVLRNSICFVPTPTISAYNAISLSYTPHWRSPLLDYSPIDEVFPNGWEEWVVLDVLQKMNVKARILNMDDILKSKAMVEDRILRGAYHRTGEAPRMRNRYAGHDFAAALIGNGPLFWAAP